MSDLSDVTIGITTFLRPGYLAESVRSLTAHLPECPVIIADDSIPAAPPSICYALDWYCLNAGPIDGASSYRKLSHPLLLMPFDSGLSAKRNLLVKSCQTKYFLIWTDDFKADEECRAGVLKMIEFLDGVASCQVVGGRVDNQPYEANLEYVPGSHIKETRFRMEQRFIDEMPGSGFTVDLIVNYFLGRTEVMKHFPWPEEMKIGGEHVCFFLDLKLANQKVSWLPKVNVKTMTLGPEAQDPRYPAFRGRAYELGHQAMKRRYNIKRYVGMNGDVS